MTPKPFCAVQLRTIYGLAKVAPFDADIVVDRNESFADDYDEDEEE